LSSVKFLLLIIFISIFSTCAADNIENLYEARVLIEPSIQTEQAYGENPDQKQLVYKAFREVLYKVTGSREFLAIADSKKLLANGENLVQKFGYENLLKEKTTEDPQSNTKVDQTTSESKLSQAENKSGVEVRPEAIGTSETKPALESDVEDSQETENQQETPVQKVFWVRFNKQQTNQLLKEYGLPVWDSLRPNTLIWLSIEENRQRSILTPAVSPQPFETIKKQAKIRGIPILVPFGDLEDKNRLTIADLWGNFSDAILAASQRYHTQAVLAVRVFREPSGLWIGNWSLYILGENSNWQVRNEDLAVLLSRGVDRLANNLATRFAVQIADNKQNSLLIQVNNVVDFQGFLKVKKYLAKLPALKKSKLLAAYRDSLLYEVEYLSTEKHLLQTLNLGNVLQKVESSSTERDNGQLEYTPVILDGTPEDKGAVTQNVAQTQTNNNVTTPTNLQNNDTSTKTIAKEDYQEESKTISLPVPDVEYWLVN